MKKISFYILIIVFFSCGKNNTEKEYSNGVLVSERIKINDSLTKYIEYYPNSSPSKIYYLTNNNKEKEYIEYFKNGVIKQKGLYFNDLKEGYWKLYDTTGSLIKEEYFDSNIKKFLISYLFFNELEVEYIDTTCKYTDIPTKNYYLIKNNKEILLGRNYKNSKGEIIDEISDYIEFNNEFDTIRKTNYKYIYFKFFKKADEKVRIILGLFDNEFDADRKINYKYIYVNSYKEAGVKERINLDSFDIDYNLIFTKSADTIQIGFDDKYTYKVQALKLGLNKIQGFVQYVNFDSSYRTYPFFVDYFCIEK